MYARRNVLKGMAGTRLAGLPLATLRADPEPASAASIALHDYAINTPRGRRVLGALALPRGVPAPTAVLIHEWWGLNDQIKGAAAEFGKLGYLALTADLMDGRVATTPGEASALVGAVDPEAATDALAGWIEWLRAHDALDRKTGTVGWRFGGGWSVNAAIETPVEATVVYDGRVARTAEDLRLKGPVVGLFAMRDQFIDETMVSAWEDELAKAGNSYTTHSYDADYGFANPTSGRCDQADARLAWNQTVPFFGVRH